MNQLYLSKTKYCRAIQCPKMLWMDSFKPEEAEQTTPDEIFETGTEVGELAKGIFGKYTDIEYNSDKKQMIIQTEEALKNKPNIITEASFSYEHNFCSVDILKNDEDGVEIYEVKSSNHLKDVYIDDASYQYYVLTNLGFNVKKVCIVHLNKEYVRNGELELDKLFQIEDITEIALDKFEEIKNNIEELNKYIDKYQSNKEPEDKIGKQCFKPYVCQYWSYCTRHLPEKNLFKVKGLSQKKKFEFYNQGKYSFEDIQNEAMNPKYKEQIDFEINDLKDKIEVEKIRYFMNTLSVPIYFLDFETINPAIPIYDGTHPYMQIPFQYSLHYIEDEKGVVKHKEYLAEPEIDARREIAEKLVQEIPMNVCVVAYNMGFEKKVLKDLAEAFPDLSEHLLNIRENMKDLMIPFQKRNYYTKAMEGFYTIKYVLPALFPDDPELDYHNLEDVHNGGEAPEVYLKLSSKSKEEQEKLRKALLEYCKLDTYGLVKIWKRLREVIGEE